MLKLFLSIIYLEIYQFDYIIASFLYEKFIFSYRIFKLNVLNSNNNNFILNLGVTMSSKRYPQDILVSCEIPWSDNEILLDDIFRKEIQTSINNGFTNMYIFGTASEAVSYTHLTLPTKA